MGIPAPSPLRGIVPDVFEVVPPAFILLANWSQSCPLKAAPLVASCGGLRPSHVGEKEVPSSLV
jgi:hypothetical protein